MKKLLALTTLPLVLACASEQPAAQAAPPPTTQAPRPPRVPVDVVRAAIVAEPPENVLATDTMMLALNTPFSRIAYAAQAAKKQYRPFTEKDVTDALAAPETHVYAPNVGIAEVAAVVIAPIGSTGIANAIRPIRTEPAAGFETPGLLAAFPVDAIQDGREFRIVLSTTDAEFVTILRKMCKRSGPTKDTAECAVPIDTSKIR